jgi:hypothetical protein
MVGQPEPFGGRGLKACGAAITGVIAIIASIACFAPDARAQSLDTGYDAVVLRAQAVDRRGNAVPGVRLRFDARLDGLARCWDHENDPVHEDTTRVVTTDAGGRAALTIDAPCPNGERGHWFQGTVTYHVAPVQEPGAGCVLVGDGPAERTEEIPGDPALLRLTLFERPDTTVDGFPIWAGRGGRLDRIVVLVEGFDLYNRYSATDTMNLIGGAGDFLRAEGISLLVVDFPDSHRAPDALAPIVARAIQAAAKASGHKVAVAGLSAGGVAARWALVTAENAGTPLPVHTLLCLDAPNRGANFNPSLQAMTLRYGKRADRDALSSDAARTMLTCTITDIKQQVHWRTLGLPLASRQVPSECHPDTAIHAAFYERLHHLNDHNGYPMSCRLVAVANSSRRGGSCGGSSDLLHLWLPWTYCWTLKADSADQAPGSLLPPLYVDQFRVDMGGIAGAYLRGAPTFLPAESALDAGADEVPPFDAWYARPDGLPALAHDHVDLGAGMFVVRELLQAPWTTEEASGLLANGPPTSPNGR